MALILTPVEAPVREVDHWGHHVVRFWDVDFDNNYPAGGEPLTAEQLGMAAEVGIVVAQCTGGFVFEYDHAEHTLKAFQGDNDNAADAPLIEVADTTDLSAVVGVRIMAVGV